MQVNNILLLDPVIFSATLEFNLDPFGEYTQEQLWAALHAVDMAVYVRSLPLGLDFMVAEAGDNFSAGQKQLLCIARVILQQPSIILMDEATARF